MNFSLFVFVIIVTAAYCFNPQTCRYCNKCNQKLAIKEHCDEQCGKESFAVEEGDEVNLTCFSCDNDVQGLEWIYSGTHINPTVSHKNTSSDHSWSQLKLKAGKLNGAIKCGIIGTNHTVAREYYVCDKFPKLKLKCEAYPSANELLLSLDCNVTIDNTFTKINRDICQYEIITDSELTIVDANNTFDDKCIPNCQMKTIHFPFLVDLPLKIVTKSGAKNTTHDLTISDYRKIYRHNSKPVFNKSNDGRCLISMASNIPIGVISSDENAAFNYRIIITDAKTLKTVNRDNFTIMSEIDENDEIYQKFWVPQKESSALKAYRNYSIEIFYKLNGSEIINGPHYIQFQTEKSLPNVFVNISRGSYIEDHGEWFIFWKPVPEEDFSGSSGLFQYVIFYGNGHNFTNESYFKLSSHKFPKENIFPTVMINCKNEIGFGPKNTTLEMDSDLTTTPKTSVIVTSGRSVVQWSLVSNATSYIVFWCFTDTWTNCNGGINWQNVNENETFLDINTNSSNYVFGVSTCYDENKCSQIKQASKHKKYEPHVLEDNIKVHDVINDTVLIEWSIEETSDYNNFIEYFDVIVRLNSKADDYLRINTTESSIQLLCNELADNETILISIIPFSKMFDFGYYHNGSVSSLTKNVQCRRAENFMPIILSIIALSIGFVVVVCILFSILIYKLCKMFSWNRINKRKRSEGINKQNSDEAVQLNGPKKELLMMKTKIDEDEYG